MNPPWVRLSNRDSAGNKRDGGQFCFHVFVSLSVAEPFASTIYRRPPEMRSVSPVVHFESSEAKNTAAGPMITTRG
jgi:hypothetical protein